MQFKTIFIKTFQRSFQNIEEFTHDLNYHGVWKPNYLLLYKKFIKNYVKNLMSLVKFKNTTKIS